jgi:AcrR family transcriptional regulator
MSRVALISDQSLLEAARTVIQQRGLRATTAEIAETAGVSEGLLFKRFRSKAELFHAALTPVLAHLPAFLGDLEASAGQGDVQVRLLELARELRDHMRRSVPLVLVAWSAGASIPDHFTRPDSPFRCVEVSISGYLEAEMRLGRLRTQDPLTVARAIVGSVHQFVVFEVLRGGVDQPAGADERYLASLTGLFWNGLVPTAPPGPVPDRIS